MSREGPGIENHRNWWIQFKEILANSIPPIDSLSQQRAAEVVEKANLIEHIKPGGTYLDLGSGIGHIAEHLATAFGKDRLRILAMDAAHHPVKKVTDRLAAPTSEASAVHFLRAIGEQLPVKNNSLDGVLLAFVLHHASPDVQAEIWNEIKRVLKTDGQVFLIEDIPATPADKKQIERIDALMNLESASAKHFYRSDAEWKEFLDRNGWRIVNTSYFTDTASQNRIPHASYILKKLE